MHQGKVAVEFSWNPSTDDYTGQSGLTYSLKIGTTENGDEIMSPNANLNGSRKTAEKGNVEHNLKWKLSLSPGTYYSSVQSIDAAYLGSAFSKSVLFNVDEQGINSSPIAEDQKVTVTEQVESEITLTASDAEGDELTYFIVDQPKNGEVELEG